MLDIPNLAIFFLRRSQNKSETSACQVLKPEHNSQCSAITARDILVSLSRRGLCKWQNVSLAEFLATPTFLPQNQPSSSPYLPQHNQTEDLSSQSPPPSPLWLILGITEEGIEEPYHSALCPQPPLLLHLLLSHSHKCLTSAIWLMGLAEPNTLSYIENCND